MAPPARKSTALWVVRRLRAAGFEALLAGGCVRDMLLGVRSKDYDVATDATPGQVRRLFRHVLLVGAKFGVAMVIHKGRKVEVATFRSDVSYSDGRRPDAVRFASPREDAMRRDFTINGMFYDPVDKKVIDYVGGRADLRRGLIRTIGPPEQRFAEDYLRMIRAVRFAVRFDFRIAPATAAAVRSHAPKIASISGERIFDELSKMLSLPSAAAAMKTMHKLKLAEAILGELFAASGLWVRGVRRVEHVAARGDLVLSLAALLAELEPKGISRIVRRWGASNELKDALGFLAGHVDDYRTACGLPLAQFKRLMANRNFHRLCVLWRAEEKLRTGGAGLAASISRRANSIPPAKVAPPPFVTGADLKALGLTEGPQLGRVLHQLYDAQLNEQLLSRSSALKAARKMVPR